MTASDYVVNTFSYIWQKPVDDCIRHLARQGYRNFEVLLTAPHMWPADFDRSSRTKLTQLVRQLGARIVSLNAGGFDNNMVSPAANVRTSTLTYLSDAIDLAADVSATYVVMSPGMGRPLLGPPKEWLLGWFHSGMEVLVRHAESRGVQLLLENIPFAFLPGAEEIMDAIGEFPAERVGVVYDVANAVYVREDPIAGLQQVAPRLRLAHLSDTPLETWRHDAVGRGVVPFERFGAALRELRYREPVVLEIVSRDPDPEIKGSINELGRLGW